MRRILWWVGCAASAIVLLWFWREAKPDASAVVAAVATAGVEAGAAPSANALDAAADAGVAIGSVDARTPPSLPLPATLPALPNATMPFADQQEALMARAIAGDGEAACRLVVLSERCVFRAHKSALRDMVTDRTMKAPGPNMKEVLIDAAARLAEEAAVDDALCGNVEITEIPDVDESLGTALGRMTQRQKVVMAMVRADGRIARLGDRGAAMFPPDPRDSLPMTPQFYSDHLVAFLHEGLAARDPLALEGMVLLHLPTPANMNLGLRITLPDQYRFALYARTSLELNGAMALGSILPQVLDRALDAMSPEKRQQLEAEVSALVTDFRAAQHLQKAAPKSSDTNLAELCAG